jgi:muconate cycloisomerase
MFRITKIEALSIAVPLKTPIKMSMETIKTCDNLVVRITNSEGFIGWGEAPAAPTFSGETTPGMIAAVNFMAARLENKEINSPQIARDVVEGTMYGNAAAKSAIDMALMDLIGKTLGISLFEILGGRKRDSASVIWLVAGTEDELELVDQQLSEGFEAFKVKVGSNSPQIDLERASKVRTRAPAGTRVSADANQGYTPRDALTFASGTEAAGLDFFEQPVMGTNVEAMRDCAAITSVPLGADEGLHSLSDIKRHHKMKAAKGGSLKLIKFGGIGQVMEAANLMQSLGWKINLAGKAANSSIGAAAAAHIAMAIPSLDWDISISSQYLSDDVVKTPLSVKAGHIDAPNQGPGLGIIVDEEKIAHYRNN